MRNEVVCIQCKRHLSNTALECERCKNPICYKCTYRINGVLRCTNCVSYNLNRTDKDDTNNKIKHYQRFKLGQRYVPILVRDGETSKISARCAYCGSHENTVKDGFIYKSYGRRRKIPRWKCNSCVRKKIKPDGKVVLIGRTFTLINEELL